MTELDFEGFADVRADALRGADELARYRRHLAGNPAACRLFAMCGIDPREMLAILASVERYARLTDAVVATAAEAFASDATVTAEPAPPSATVLPLRPKR